MNLGSKKKTAGYGLKWDHISLWGIHIITIYPLKPCPQYNSGCSLRTISQLYLGPILSVIFQPLHDVPILMLSRPCHPQSLWGSWSFFWSCLITTLQGRMGFSLLLPFHLSPGPCFSCSSQKHFRDVKTTENSLNFLLVTICLGFSHIGLHKATSLPASCPAIRSKEQFLIQHWDNPESSLTQSLWYFPQLPSVSREERELVLLHLNMKPVTLSTETHPYFSPY